MSLFRAVKKRKKNVVVSRDPTPSRVCVLLSKVLSRKRLPAFTLRLWLNLRLFLLRKKVSSKSIGRKRNRWIMGSELTIRNSVEYYCCCYVDVVFGGRRLRRVNQRNVRRFIFMSLLFLYPRALSEWNVRLLVYWMAFVWLDDTFPLVASPALQSMDYCCVRFCCCPSCWESVVVCPTVCLVGPGQEYFFKTVVLLPFLSICLSP